MEDNRFIFLDMVVTDYNNDSFPIQILASHEMIMEIESWAWPRYAISEWLLVRIDVQYVLGFTSCYKSQ